MLTGVLFFFFNDTATTEIYTLSLHDALPICSNTRSSWRATASWRTREGRAGTAAASGCAASCGPSGTQWCSTADRKSTRLNSSHANISYAVFCLKKKKQTKLYDLVGSLGDAD